MSIEITIRNNGLFKKPLPLSVLTDGLNYGRYDGTRLERGEVGPTELVLYHPRHIARGFSAVWREGERGEVSLRLPSPTCREELEDFYDTALRIVQFWKRCALSQDGIPLSPADLGEMREKMAAFNLDALRRFCADRDKGDFTLFCALWPLVLGEEETDRFREAESLDDFRDYLHEKQNMDVYYARPSFYKNDNGAFGSYLYSENVDGIFPVRPYVPFGVTDSRTGGPLTINRWFVTLYSTTLDTVLGHIPYGFFWDMAGEATEYDGAHRLVRGVSLERIERAVEQHGVRP